MNSLNSVLLEGNLVADPVRLDSHFVIFTIESVRFTTIDDVLVKETSKFTITVPKGNLAKICFDTLKKDRGVRVVGRLRQNSIFNEGGKGNSTIEIIAEHVEFKPVFQKETAKAS